MTLTSWLKYDVLNNFDKKKMLIKADNVLRKNIRKSMSRATVVEKKCF